MHPNGRQGARRVHAAEFKAKVLAQCRDPEASVAAVAMANGVNANLVRKWLKGQGLKRTGLAVPQDGAAVLAAPEVNAQGPSTPPAQSAMEFIPVGLAAASSNGPGITPDALSAVSPEASQIHVELRHGHVSMAVRWPTSQAQDCAAWLSEVSGALLKG